MQAGYAFSPTQNSIFNGRRSRLIKWMDELKRRQALQDARVVLAMAQHPRLGANSPLKLDVLPMIVDHLY
jgi:hypothetical protein